MEVTNNLRTSNFSTPTSSSNSRSSLTSPVVGQSPLAQIKMQCKNGQTAHGAGVAGDKSAKKLVIRNFKRMFCSHELLLQRKTECSYEHKFLLLLFHYFV